MSTGDLQFRTATIGGFHKKDVLTYIETSSRSQLEKVEKLKKELDLTTKAKLKLEEQAAETRKREAELTTRVAELTGKLSEQSVALDQATADLGPKSARLEELESLATDLQERLAKAEPAAKIYEKLKDLTAGIELEARQRAQMMEQDAQERAQAVEQGAQERAQAVEQGAQERAQALEQGALDRADSIEREALQQAEIVEREAREKAEVLRVDTQARVDELSGELEQWLGRVRSEYGKLREDVSTAVSRTAGELEQMKRCLNALAEGFNGHDADLDVLLDICQRPEDGAEKTAQLESAELFM